MFSKISTSVQENEVFENIVQQKVLCKFRNYNILFFFINIIEKKSYLYHILMARQKK